MNENTPLMLQNTPISPPQMLRSDSSGIDLINKLKGKYSEDKLFQKILNDPKPFRNFTVKKGSIYLKE